MKKTALLGLLTAFALILSFLESLIPNIVPIPGFKLGLANFAVLTALYLFGFKEAVLVDICRMILSALLFGSMFSFIYSLSGAIFALLIEYLVKNTKKFSPVGVSIAGAVFHNIGQFAAAVIIMRTLNLLYYMPFTLLFAVGTGFIVGFLVNTLKPRLMRFIEDTSKNEKSE